MESLYLPAPGDRLRGLAYRPPERFKHGRWYCVAKLEPTADGQPVYIDELRMPARFFRLRVAEWSSRPGYTLRTGSGQDEWIAATAAMIADGRLGCADGGNWTDG